MPYNDPKEDGDAKPTPVKSKTDRTVNQNSNIRLVPTSKGAPVTSTSGPGPAAPSIPDSSSSQSQQKKRTRWHESALTSITPSYDGSNSDKDRSTSGGHHEEFRWDMTKSDPGTPGISETAAEIRRTLSSATLSSALQTLQSSAVSSADRAELLRRGRRAVWRSADEARKLPPDAERALVLASRRGLRSFILAYLVRAGIDLLLGTIRNARKRRPGSSAPAAKGFVAVLGSALLGKEPRRLGATVGTFAFLNTAVGHLLRLAPEAAVVRLRILLFLRKLLGFRVSPKHNAKLEAAEKGEWTYTDEDGEPLALGERRWHASAAGAIASLALLWEDQPRRIAIAQQMFVRGLQSSYNTLSARHGFTIPYGSIIVFGLSCGQIMFAFLLSPSTIPREYVDWIQRASQVSKNAISINYAVERRKNVPQALLSKALEDKRLTAHNRGKLEDLLGSLAWRQNPNTVPCEVIHPWADSCRWIAFERFFMVFRWMLPVYSALHLIPMIVLRHKHFMRDPLGMLRKAAFGIFRSSSFLGLFVTIYQGLLCLRIQTMEGWFGKPAPWLYDLVKRKQVFWLMGFATCLSVFAEEKRRRAELGEPDAVPKLSLFTDIVPVAAMYVLPKALESVWSSARRRAWVPVVPFGENILAAAAMAMVMDAYRHKPQALSGLVRRVVYQLIGPP